MENIEWLNIALVIGVGIIAGFINTLAGSGSLLTLPVLIFLGLPANVANGTNRIAILIQCLVSSRKFKQEKLFTYKEIIQLGIPTIIGSIFGVWITRFFSNDSMEKAIGVLIAVMLVITVIKPQKWMNKEENTRKFGLLQIIVFFICGAYGGFIQAGVGFFLLAGLLMASGYELVKANAIKNVLVLLYTPFALTLFIIDGNVNFIWGFILAIGNALGAYVASTLAVKKGAEFIRYFLIVALIAASLKLFGVF